MEEECNNNDTFKLKVLVSMLNWASLLLEYVESFISVILHDCFVEALDFSLISASGQIRLSVPLLTWCWPANREGQFLDVFFWNLTELNYQTTNFAFYITSLWYQYENSNRVKHQKAFSSYYFTPLRYHCKKSIKVKHGRGKLPKKHDSQKINVDARIKL